MNVDEVRSVCAVAGAAMPGRFYADVDAWAADLADVDASVAQAVMRAWLAERSDPPTRIGFVNACAEEAAARATVARARRNLNAVRRRVTDVPRAVGTVQYLRELLAQSVDPDAAPIDPDAVVAEARRRGLSDDGPLRRCTCEGGFVFVTDAPPNTVEPCGRCNAAARDRWTSGEYAPRAGTGR